MSLHSSLTRLGCFHALQVKQAPQYTVTFWVYGLINGAGRGQESTG